jgi:hypothetical protein
MAGTVRPADHPRRRPPYKDWLERNGRVLLDEHDSAFHTAMGYRPHVDGTGTDRDIGFHPLRLDPDDFE